MSNQLAQYRSSNGQTRYFITEGKDGVIYCTCPGWRLHNKNGERSCKHLLDFKVTGGIAAEKTFSKTENLTQHPTLTKDSTIEDVIGIASRMLR